MLNELRELWRYRELLYIFVRRDLKVRYKNSVLGFGWSMVNPLLQVLTITFAILFLMPKGSKPENYHLYTFCATLPWLFFSTAMMDSAASLLNYHQLMRRTYFPRELVPLATVAANLVHFLLATVVFLIYTAGNAFFWMLFGKKFEWSLQWSVLLIPLPMLGLLMLVTGAAMIISVWALYFEDVRFIADSGLKIFYWMVPVVYWADMILMKDDFTWNREAYMLYMLNPLAAFITAFRKLSLVPTKMLGVVDEKGLAVATPPMTGAEWGFLGVAMLTSLAILVLGYRYFCTRKWKLAERA